MNAPFDPQPTFTGELLLIRPVRAEDRDGMYAAASDPGIWKLHPSPDRHTEPLFRQYFDAALASGSAFTFVDRLSNEIVGSSRYYGADPGRSEIEIGWTFLVRRCWGGVYNFEAKKLMIEHAFGSFDTVVFWVGEHNFRSRGAMHKIGGALRDGTVTRDVSGGRPCVVFEIRKQNWMRLSSDGDARQQASRT